MKGRECAWSVYSLCIGEGWVYIYNDVIQILTQMESIIGSKDKLHFYEYLEADILQEYFRTGIHYFVNSILNAHPRLITWRYYSLEISTLIDFVKDLISLLRNNATYAQNFYNLERGKASKWSALKGAVIWTILPYLGTKLEDYYNQIVGDEIDGKRIGKFKKIVKLVYPYLYAIWGIVQTFYKFRYLYLQESKDHHYSLFYKIANVHLQYKETEEESKYPLLELFKKPGLLIVLIGHKILSWYFAQKKEKRTVTNNQKQQVKAPVSEQKVEDSGLCSICTKKLKNATIVRASGYVYCWDCINGFVSREGRCPMSGLKVAPEDLQILYD